MSSNAESNFRNAFKNFGARGGVAAADNSASSGSGGGALSRASDWFGGVRNQVSGYVPVSLGGTPQQEEDWLGLSWFQRMAGFAICVAGGVACFMIAFFVGLPLLLLKPSKFATSFTLGSILLMCSFALLKGPATHFKALISRERLPFTGAYVGSMIFVLYSSLVLNSYILTIIGTVIEILALLYYFTSYSPFSSGSIRLGSRMAGNLLPV
ncbi:protein transport protein sft2 [Lobosporangium transversale]|uniref:Protein transport protein SFT2 n=1 Tax=Lobosporangium transversale TaxID=64571 RepID=A0A1Y2H081_9FUNG|nr:Got1/Sft2-like family-domain-containing protein [Lobosporangium transversale]KAF9907787.1 protein transport protein sft2 [Lobosporangium transversale]ORZ27980.1 Got1/Sft2-like family-domain-containing protein [Lobosporangium transversale]|eukprot:XP_021885683.1 Got1/Sft2-like family-domain-containing protein [Lobosporangium transversale]